MPGIPQAGPDPGSGRELLVVVHHAQVLERVFRLGRGIEHAEIATASLRPLCLGLLQMRTIREHDHQQFARGLGGIDGPAETFTHQTRQQPAVVEVRVRQHHEREFGRLEGPRATVAFVKTTPALKEAAVDKKLVFPHGEVVA